MTLADPAPDPGDPARLAVELERTVDRLRSLSGVRLATQLPDGRSRASAAFALAQVLADRAAELEGQPVRRLPPLADLAAGDVLGVCGHDLLAQVRLHADLLACREAVEALVALRRSL